MSERKSIGTWKNEAEIGSHFSMGFHVFFGYTYARVLWGWDLIADNKLQRYGRRVQMKCVFLAPRTCLDFIILSTQVIRGNYPGSGEWISSYVRLLRTYEGIVMSNRVSLRKQEVSDFFPSAFDV